jgi:hypothetical protein
MRAIIALLTVLLTDTIARACPTCGKAVEVLPPGSVETAGRGGPGGFNASIYVLLGAVLLAMGFLAWNLLRSGKPVGKQDVMGEGKTA